MKKSLILTFAFTLAFAFNLQAQTEEVNQGNSGKELPAINLKDLEGAMINSEKFGNDGKPFVISFWATWCKPCILELTTIQDVYEEWVEETGVKVIAISIDDARNSAKVAPFVKGRGWEYEVYIDENADFKRAMGVNMVPHTFLVDGSGKIVWDHSSYSPGDEDELYEKIVEYSSAKPEKLEEKESDN